MQNLKLLLIFILLTKASLVGAGEVISFDSLKKKRCASLLSSSLNLGPRTGEAKILTFAPVSPENSQPAKSQPELKGQLFIVLHAAVHNIRGLESIIHNIQYQSPELDLLTERSDKPLLTRLIDFLNSWDAISIHEEHLQEFLKAFLTRNVNRAHEDVVLRDLLISLKPELLNFYSEEAVGSLIYTLETATKPDF